MPERLEQHAQSAQLSGSTMQVCNHLFSPFALIVVMFVSSPQCGPFGTCDSSGSQPVCVCDPLWLPTNGPHPCSQNQCPYGFPADNGHGFVCQCNDTRYTYTPPPGSGLAPCQALACTEGNGVPCGQLNCELIRNCFDPVEEQCMPECTGAPVPGNVCFNGTCTCAPTSRFDPTQGVCVSICGPYPQVQQITVNPDNSVTCTCACDKHIGDGNCYSATENCYEPVCLNGATYNYDIGKCICAVGWIGDRCNQTYCNGQGVFNASNPTVCTCFPPFTGQYCDENTCQNGSPYTGSGVPFSCHCKGYPDSVYYGMNCEVS